MNEPVTKKELKKYPIKKIPIAKFISLAALVFILLSANGLAYSDNFNDCTVADWTLVGSWQCGSPAMDGSNYTYITTVPTASLSQTIGTGFTYWEVETKLDTTGGGEQYNTFFFKKNATANNYIRLYSVGGAAPQFEGYGFTYTPYTAAFNTWYRITINEYGANYIIKIINSSGTVLNSQTVPITVSITNADRITLSITGYTPPDISATGYFDNVVALTENPGTGLVNAPSTVVLNTLANISWTLTTRDETNYNYFVDVYDVSGDVTSISITGASGTVNYDTLGKTEGTYTVYLKSTNIATGLSYYLATDTMFVDSNVAIYGYTRDAITGAVLGSVSVNFSQSGSWYNTTSSAGGYYSLTGMASGYPISINASKSGYTHLNYSYTPTFDYNYSVDLYLWNTSYHSGDTGIEGLVVKSPFKNLVSGATANLWNSTQSWTLTSDSNGYFSQTLANASDTITSNATKDGFTTPSNQNTSITSLSWSQVVLTLTPEYTFTIRAKDSVTGGYLSEFNTVIDDGTTVLSNTTTTGTISNTLNEGVYFVTVSATGYYGSGSYYLLTSDRTIEVSLTPYSGTSDAVPSWVYEKFIVRGLFDNPYPGLTLNVYNGSSSTVAFTGTTDYMGQVVFKLTKDTYYRGELSGTGITSMTFYFYGKEESYLITILSGFPTGGDRYTDILTNLTVQTFNATHSNLTIIYNDTRNTTSALNFYATNLTTETSCYQSSTLSVKQLNCTVLAKGTYQFGFNATSSIYGFFQEDKVINFGAGNTSSPLIPTTPPGATAGATATILHWGSIMLIVLTASLFSVKNLKLGAVIVPTVALITWAFGWLDADWKLLTLAMVIGVLIYSRMSESKVSYQ